MPMRVDCKFYESRTYPTGDTVRMCRIDLAPEAPWRCPDDCPGYQRKIIDGGWVTGSLAQRPAPEDPPRLDDETAALLDQAENIINAAGPEIIAEIHERRQVERKRQTKKRRRWWPF
jgi:hypothetical protein